MENICRKIFSEIIDLSHETDINYISQYEFDEKDNLSDLLTITVSNEFLLYLVLPIIEGKYDNELEKICKRNLLNLSLKEK